MLIRCPKCKRSFVKRNKRRCPYCGFLIVKLGEYFVVDDNKPFGLIIKDKYGTTVEVAKIQGRRLIILGSEVPSNVQGKR